MPIRLDWNDDSKTILHIIASGAWNWKELHKYLTLANTTIQFNKIAHPVEFIIDLTGGEKMPAGAMAHLRSLAKPLAVTAPTRIIIVGVEEAVYKPLGAIDRVYRAPGAGAVYFVNSQEEAQALIEGWAKKNSS